MLLFEKIKQKKINIFIIIIICLFIGVIVSINMSNKEYISTSTLLLIKTENIDNEIKKTGNLELSNTMISTFEEILKSDENISKTKINEDISNKDFRKKIDLERVSNSDTFQIKVKNEDENLAEKENEKLIEIFNSKIENLYSNVEVYIIDNPHIEKNYININAIPLIISILIGFIIESLYIMVIIILEQNKKIHFKIEKELNLKKLVEIPLKLYKKEQNEKNELIAYDSEKSLVSKAFKELRSNIQFINVNNNEKNIILITSSYDFEGKSFVSANIAVSFAEAGKKVILIDADMINGRQNQIFNIPNNLGFSNYLSGLNSNGMEIKKLTNKFIQETAIKNLNIITSGTIPPNSTELLSSDRLDQLIKDLSVFYDVVIIDGTSILNSMDSLILARKANSTIIVSDYKKTKIDDLIKSKRDIQNIGGRVIGIVVNKVKTMKSKKEIKQDFVKIKLKFEKKIKKIVKKIKENSKQKLLNEGNNTNIEIVIDSKIHDTKKEICEKQNQETYDNNFIKNVKNIVLKFGNIKINNKKNLETKLELQNDEVKKENSVIIQNFEENYNKENITNDKISNNNLKKTGKNILKIKVFFSTVKSNIIKIFNKSKEYFRNLLDNKNLEIVQNKENSNEKHLIQNSNLEKNQKNKNVDVKKKNKNHKNKEIDRNGNSILIFIDAEEGYCRVFSKYCFIEKKIKNDKTNSFENDQYSFQLVTSRTEGIMNVYGLTKKQAQKVDPLIYISLCEYDNCIWIQEKIISNKAETYILEVTREYEKKLDESDKEFEIRNKRLVKDELKKNEIEIEYKLENIWKTSKISFIDKIMINHFAKLYDLKNELKTQEELNSSVKNKKFYNEIIIKAENKFKKMSNDKKNEQDITLNSIKIKSEESKDEEMKKIKEERKKIKEQKKQEKREILIQKKKEKMEKQEKIKKQKDEEKERQKEEARIEEELLVDNLYPKTKNNRDI